MARWLGLLIAGCVIGVAATLAVQHVFAPEQRQPETVAERAQPRAGVPGLGAASPSIEMLRNIPPDAPAATVQHLAAAKGHGIIIPITPGFEQALAPSPGSITNAHDAASVHERLIAEERDDAWAESMEGQIRTFVDGYFDQRGLDRHTIDLAVVRCGATICEIQSEGMADGSPRDWQRVGFELIQGPIGQDFNPHEMLISVFTLPNGETGFVTFLVRKSVQ